MRCLIVACIVLFVNFATPFKNCYFGNYNCFKVNMKNTIYMERILKANTLEELAQVKASFLAECEKREQKITVSNILSEIGNFCSAKVMFESLIIPLMSKKGGKNLVNKYTKAIKENKSLKTLYTYYEGLKENDNYDNYVNKINSFVFSYNVLFAFSYKLYFFKSSST